MKRAILGLLLVFAMLSGLLLPLSAEETELEWNLLTDREAGYRVSDESDAWSSYTEEDGTPYRHNDKNKSGSLRIYDDQNLLSTYKTFSLEGDFYFVSFPTGLRDGKYTPEQKPFSFLCWMYGTSTPNAFVFNALRLDSEGYIHTAGDGSGKTDIQLETGKWINIKCVFTPATGVSELLLDGKKVLDFTIDKFIPEKHTSNSVRFFDGYYKWEAKMKNIKVKTDGDYEITLKREDAADYLGIQTSRPVDGKFNARAIFGVDSVNYDKVGYEAILFQDGKQTVLSENNTEIYLSVWENGNLCNIRQGFGYAYGSALRLDALPEDESFELIVRPYVLLGNMRRYGVSKHLYYNAEKDENGFPIFSDTSRGGVEIAVSDDTYICNDNGARSNTSYKEAELLEMRNAVSMDTMWSRTVFFKFILDAEQVKALEAASGATLDLYVKSHDESNATRVLYPITVSTTGTDWNGESLTYNNYKKNAPIIEQVASASYDAGGYVSIDIFDCLKSSVPNADGSLTLSFCVTQEAGHGNTKMSYLYSKEGKYPPKITLHSNAASGGAEYDLGKRNNKGYEAWGYAESIVDEWFDKIEPTLYKTDADGKLIGFETPVLAPEGYGGTEAVGDFKTDISWIKDGTEWRPADTTEPSRPWRMHNYARTLDTLGTITGKRFVDSALYDTVSEFDAYGGITNLGVKGNATGFYHTEVINGKTYIIDPLGNPFYVIGLNSVYLGETSNLREYSLEQYGSKENYYKEISAELRESGVNVNYEGDTAELLAVENGLSSIVSINVTYKYMTEIGLYTGIEGQFFANNNTINVFDPDYVSYVNGAVSATIAEKGYANMPNVLGYTADNELPAGNDLLLRYLELDPRDPNNAFSYATAWAWLSRRLDIPYPTMRDLTAHPDRAQLNSEFLGFVYARSYRVIGEALKTADPNHMYFGSRVNSTCVTDPYWLRAAGHYLDVLTINLYDGLFPNTETIENFYRYSGKPFIVSEFFAKAGDAIDANGYKLCNSTGAGSLVKTQADRATYYENYTLTLLESNTCVGWLWYRFRDNDQTLYQSANGDILRIQNVETGKKLIHNYRNELDEIVLAKDAESVEAFYNGEPIASNMNVNKGYYNTDFSSVVTVYRYKNGELLSCESYKVEKPTDEYPASGTVLRAEEGNRTFTIGSVREGDVLVSTELTVYEGKYVALMSSVKEISDHLVGLLQYFES